MHLNPIRLSQWLLWLLILPGLFAAGLWSLAKPPAPLPDIEPNQSSSVALAVIGDSDSHSYHDVLWFRTGDDRRGGKFRSITFQWSEVIGRLRSDEIDLGPWMVNGERPLVAKFASKLGIPKTRMYRKLDYYFNFAHSGAVCSDIIGSPYEQAPALASIIQDQPLHWKRGIVVIRIGVNSFGNESHLEKLSANPNDPDVQAIIQQCVTAIRDSVQLLQKQQPGLRFVLVGIFDNSNWARALHRWQSPQALANISKGLDQFDHGLRALTLDNPDIVFFDDRAWFAAHWGTRSAQGKPAYHDVALGNLHVSNSIGDAPNHATVTDGHAGTVWNALWAKSLLELLNLKFGTRFTPITETEISSLLIPPTDDTKPQ